MRRVKLVVMVLALAGCASVGDLEKKAPSFTDHTNKSADEYRRCIVPAWVKIYSSVHAVDTSDGYQVIAPSPVAETDELLIVRAMTNGADVSLHERIASMADSRYLKEAKACL